MFSPDRFWLSQILLNVNIQGRDMCFTLTATLRRSRAKVRSKVRFTGNAPKGAAGKASRTGPRFIKSKFIEPEDRIVGGTETTITDFPFAVSLEYQGNHSCGGSIISEKYILTAAHCYHASAKDYTVRVGSSERENGGTVLEVKKFIVHPNYDPDVLFDYDMALLELTESIEMSPTSQPVELPEEGRPVKAGEIAVVVGWGRLKSNGESPTNLQQVSIPVVDIVRCNKTYWEELTPRMFCAGEKNGGRDSCQGDSGGPLLINDTQIGIVSFGLGCGREPGIYTNVPELRSWISDIAGV
ncbi:Trypsin-1 [Gryllus bimaculatus]|nr:Trypsin-1 [Gryllus bimaculatus]